MPMLEANDDAFWLENFDGAVVFDARGRQLRSVIACNPLTGEVIRADFRTSLWSRMVRPLWPIAQGWLRELVFGFTTSTRHGFWPAPLTVVDRRAAAADAIRSALK
jgi:hypothetical protein